jgi:hypothetical protein
MEVYMKIIDVKTQRLRKRQPKLADKRFVALFRDLSQVAYLRDHQIEHVHPNKIRNYERKTFVKLMRYLTSQ